MFTKQLQKEIPAMARLAWPIIMGNLTHVLLSIIDSVMVGRLGLFPLAAVSLAAAIVGFLIITSLGITSALSPIVAKHKGGGKNKSVSAAFYHALFLSLIWGAFFMLLQLFLAWKIHWFNAPEVVAPMAASYLYILAPSFILVTVFGCLRHFSEGLSRPGPILVFLIASLLLNVFFNWILIFGHMGFPAMGLDGAAWGTLLARLLTTLALLGFIFMAPFYRKYLSKPPRKVEQKYLRAHLRLGLPSSFQYACEASAFAGAAILMGWLGSIPLAAHQIVISIASATFMISLGTSVASSIRVGEAWGRGDLSGARLSGFTGIGLAAVSMSLLGILVYFFRFQIPGFFIQDQRVISEAAMLLIVAAFFQVFDGSQGVAAGALRGLQDVKWPTAITFFAYATIALPVAYILAFNMNWGSLGIWLGLAIGLATSASMLSTRFFMLTKS